MNTINRVQLTGNLGNTPEIKVFDSGSKLARFSIATKEDVANAKTDVIRWVFAFFVTLAAMIIGLYIK